MMSLTGIRGFSDPNGSWKMICILRRSGRSSSWLIFVMSRPANVIVPSVGSIRRRTDRPSVVLPQPDSPTRLNVSPALTSKSTPSTA
jgi:hypothetical protein